MVSPFELNSHTGRVVKPTTRFQFDCAVEVRSSQVQILFGKQIDETAEKKSSGRGGGSYLGEPSKIGLCKIIPFLVERKRQPLDGQLNIFWPLFDSLLIISGQITVASHSK
jgi:hypothetical protein